MQMLPSGTKNCPNRAVNEKPEKLSSTNLSQAPTERESCAAVTSRKTDRVFMFEDRIARDIHKRLGLRKGLNVVQ